MVSPDDFPVYSLLIQQFEAVRRSWFSWCVWTFGVHNS